MPFYARQSATIPNILNRSTSETKQMIEEQIWDKLQNGVNYDVLDVINESHQHSVPKDSETHFRILVVTAEFEEVGRLARHRRIHSLLGQELRGGVHALAIDAWTPAEWDRNAHRPSLSPKCRGGSKAG